MDVMFKEKTVGSWLLTRKGYRIIECSHMNAYMKWITKDGDVTFVVNFGCT